MNLFSQAVLLLRVVQLPWPGRRYGRGAAITGVK